MSQQNDQVEAVRKELSNLDVGCGDGDANNETQHGYDDKADGKPSNNLFVQYLSEGISHLKAEKCVEALIKFELAWKECTTDQQRAMIQNNRATAYEKMGDIEKALEELKMASTVFVASLIRRVQIQFKLERYEQGLDELAEAHARLVNMKQENSKCAVVDQEIRQLLLEYAASRMECIRASPRVFGLPKDYYIQAYFRQFYCDPVCRMWRGLKQHPFDPPWEQSTGFVAAIACMRSSTFAQVSDHCTTELNSEPRQGRYHYKQESLLLRGSFYHLSGDYDRAMADFQAIIDDPRASSEMKSCANVKAGICQDYWGTGGYKCSRKYFQEAESLWKQNGDAYYHAALSLIYHFGSKQPLVLDLLNKGVNACPNAKRAPLLYILWISIQAWCEGLWNVNDKDYSSEQKRAKRKAVLDKFKELEANGVFDTAECYRLFALTTLPLDPTLSGDAFDKAVAICPQNKYSMLDEVASVMSPTTRETILEAFEMFTEDPDVANFAYYHMGDINMMLMRFDDGFAGFDKSIELATSLYDIQKRMREKVEYEHCIRLCRKLKEYKWVTWFRDQRRFTV